MTETAAMSRALDLARHSPAWGGNPQVGCVLLGPDGALLGEGFHHGAGTAHAEIEALRDARRREHDPRGATAVVTLEPCNHTGHTGPCSHALVEAGVRRVVFAVADPSPEARGGAAYLRAHGVAIGTGLLGDEGRALLHSWLTAVRKGRPYVVLKSATTLDGRIAAPDGSSHWVTGEAARTFALGLRERFDAIVVGTGTALADDPRLTARRDDGSPAAHQPLRVVIGERELPRSLRLFAADDAGGPTPALHLRTRDVPAALATLWDRGVRRLLVEGGPTLAAAFVRAGAVDEIHAYIAPALLGDGPSALGSVGATAIADLRRFELAEVRRIGGDALIVARRPLDDSPAAGRDPRSNSKGIGVSVALTSMKSTDPLPLIRDTQESHRQKDQEGSTDVHGNR